MSLPAAVAVARDDHALFRPTQSEAVLTQFGAIWGLRGGEVEQRFEPDPA